MQTIGIDMAKDTFHAAFDDHNVMKFENTPAGIDLPPISVHGMIRQVS